MPTIDEQLGSIAIEVALRFDVYDSYGQRKAHTLRALRKRVPGHDPARYERAFEAARRLWQDCSQVVADNELVINHEGNTDLAPFRKHLKSQARRFGACVVNHAIWMTVFYYYLK